MTKNFHSIDLYKYSCDWLNEDCVKPKIIFMGSSTVKYSVSPKRICQNLKMKAGEIVNISYDGNSPINNYYVFKSLRSSALDDVHTIIYGIDPWLFSEKNYANVSELLFKLDIIQLLHLKIFAPSKLSFRRLFFFNIYKQLLFPSIRKIKKTNDFGADILKKKPKNFKSHTEEWFVRNFFSFSEIQFSYLKKLKEEIEKRNIRFILLFPPKQSDWRNRYLSKCKTINEEFNSLLKKELGHFDFIGSYSDIPQNIEKKCFNDQVHLNHYGQQYYSELLFNRYLSKILK